MAGCPFTRKPENCVRRQSWLPMSSDCRVCDFRGRGMTQAVPQEKESRKVNDVVQTTTNGIKEHRLRTNEKNDHHEKEENRMDATKKDLVLSKIQEHKAITRGALAGMIRLKKEEVEPIAKVLEAEGKIKTWPGKRSDSMIYTTPNLPNPLEEIDGKKPAAKKKAAPRAAGKSQRNVNKRQIDNSPSAPAPGSPPPKNGEGRTEFPGDLAGFRRVQDQFNTLVSALVHQDGEEIEEVLDEMALAALSWRRDRRATA
jgi:hypothetical protein